MTSSPLSDAGAARPGRGAVWLMAARPRTLPAAVVPVAVGTALAAAIAQAQAIPALLCAAFALLVQVGTNYANDYFDFVKGADTADRVGPTRVVAGGLVSHRAVRWAIAGAFTLAFLVGLNLVFYGGWWLLVVGLASILFGLGYTAGPYPLAYNSLGDLFVFVFFGLVAVGFTFYVQTGFFAAEVWLAGAGVGALATNILVVNNLRDRQTDARAGKKTLVVRFGRGPALFQYAAGLCLAGLVPVGFLFWGYGLPILLPLLLAPLSFRLQLDLMRAVSGGHFNSLLGRTGGFLLAYGVSLAIGVLLA